MKRYPNARLLPSCFGLYWWGTKTICPEPTVCLHWMGDNLSSVKVGTSSLVIEGCPSGGFFVLQKDPGTYLGGPTLLPKDVPDGEPHELSRCEGED